MVKVSIPVHEPPRDDYNWPIMPELPEVETMCRGISAAVGGRVRDFKSAGCKKRPILLVPDLKQIRRRVVGERVDAVERAGKRVILRFASGDRLVVEPRMTGLMLVADPPTVEHLRLRIDLSESPLSTLWFWDRRGLGVVRLLSPDQFAAELGPDSLGPDALVVSAAELRTRLETSRRAIKVALLDQRAVAGVGNLYAAEILHVARIHPELGCHRLSASQWRRLHAAMQMVLVDAIAHEGSTLSDGTYRNALNKSGGYQNCHRVYDREDEDCPTCGKSTVRRIVQAQRSTFFCPRCQPRK